MSNSGLETALSVAGVTQYIQSLLEDDPQLMELWVTGEVSSLNAHRVGLFFTLSDSEGKATIKCVVWNSQKSQLQELPKLGSEILVKGSVRLYPKKGEYQLTVYQAKATGEGLLALRYQQLRTRLALEGLFDLEIKRPLPPYPQTISVVTAATAAAWGDIQRTLIQRNPGIRVLFSPATVQGKEAPYSIVEAIERVNLDERAEVLILARGGGAVEDLWCFNDERVVRAIAESTIPVITGIGHQRDETLADLVADVNAHTPTAAAEIAVPSYDALRTEHQQRQGRLVASLEKRLKKETDKIEQLKTRLTNLPVNAAVLRAATVKTHLLQQKLQALDPKAVLKRGFSLVRQTDGQIVREGAQLSNDQELIIQLPQGSIKVKVTEILS
ncbi:exodeoxyribonuclease VII large subunit [Crocosphaera sp. XPORK-15E]|uniref:exodeoxyribonuclease VII large subunit n=1 Tax=Crocosphaera sp. XPORK-15E TaxID=3110247 RepID=UPI002B1F04C5|nr:exodeoxyribonuclease VII large subunit [Crocosphaera sp. XPORK-15E]MEA5537365.1 exodeoxyribonuclease VII large subunit [Crocosphaera sp. XPORK-15E]